MTEDFRQIDRRPLGAGLIADVTAFLEMMESALFVHLPDAVADFRVLATHGPWRAVEISTPVIRTRVAAPRSSASVRWG